MINHYTPLDVAQVLAKHLPRNIISLLDPAVGTGLLLGPVLKRYGKSLKVTGVDVDLDALHAFKTTLPRDIQVDLIHDDFLEWSKKRLKKKEDRFDCVLMNPPFSAKKMHSVQLLSEGNGLDKTRSRSVPVEAAFLYRAIQLLNPRGRLLGIFPSSLISAISTRWLRELALACGSVLYVHELPPFTFKSVEARVYLFIFEKKLQRANILLCNHDLLQPELLRISRSELRTENRLDFSFHKARRWHKEIRSATPALGWVQLDHVASVLRGPIQSPKGATLALHTTDYKNGFWYRPRPSKILTDQSVGIKRGDILVKRVGRNCGATFGFPRGHIGDAVSDCLLIIRPYNIRSSHKILFALRVILANESGKHLIERGTGASYITEEDLNNLIIPLSLANRKPQAFKKYKKAIKNRAYNKMVRLETLIKVSALAVKHRQEVAQETSLIDFSGTSA
jgi:N-6 DNA Methylase